MLLDVNYEVALANITCTPNIKNDYGHIVIKNYLDQFLYFEHDERYFSFINKFKEIIIELNDAKTLPDEINMRQKVINYRQFILNNIIFYKISEFSKQPARKQDNYYNYLPIFYDIFSRSLEPVYHIPVEYSITFGDLIKSNITSDKLAISSSSSSDKWNVF